MQRGGPLALSIERGVSLPTVYRWLRQLSVDTPSRVDPEKSYRVTDGGCWVWTRAKQSAGYGHFTLNGRWVLAHRWFYERERGAVPNGMELDHLCRNRACCNPAHLEAVPHTENVRRGKNVGRPTLRKLTTQEREDIRRRHVAGESAYSLAKQFGVSTATAWRATKADA